MEIQEGKYYRTRDGQKIGPATRWSDDPETEFNVPWDAGQYNYSKFGKSCIYRDEDDIIAEWVDLPQWRAMIEQLKENISARFDVCLENNDLEGAAKMIGYTRTLEELALD